MKHYTVVFGFFLLSVFSVMACTNNEGDSITGPTGNNPPASHTVSRDGVLHKSGRPPGDCISCHGNDLRGGKVGVSCYQCHGAEWNDD
ncbi:MAG: hypothetical protein OQK67_00665 [Chlorobium sp.]|nr:hypothetical protein [Chlorobium sp.]MCW8815969.1 hypothetical protein [Chlorobium sp.]MCW8820184.1 hypothetical protein [Ignavibacteriaceae bacterium]